MESYEQMLNRAYSAQIAHAQISRRRSQRTVSRPQPPSNRPTRVEKPSSRHTSPNSLLLRRKAGAGTLPHEQEAQYNQAASRPMARAMARLERPLSWHPSSAYQMTAPTYYQPGTVQNTPSAMGRSSYDWPEDTTDLTLPPPQPSCYNSSSPYSATVTTQQQQSIDFSQPMWINPIFGNAATYPLSQVNFPYQAYPAPQIPQAMQMTMPYTNDPDLWQQHEVPGLEDDASPSVEDSPGASSGEELVGLGLYDKTVRTSTDLLGLGVKSLKLTEGWTPPGEQSQPSSTHSSSYATPTGHHNTLPLEQQKPLTMTAQQAYPFDFSDYSFPFENDNYGTGWFDVQQAGVANSSKGMPHY